MRTLAICLSLAVCVAGTLSRAQSSDDFTIIALPDTQIYSRSYPEIYRAQTQWIADNAEALGIQLVLGLGDIVDGGGELNQWDNADSAMRLIDGRVPYMLAIGNHDYDRNDPKSRTASTKNFNTYFGPGRYAGESWYRGNFPQGSNENFYGIHTLGGRQYLVIALEFSPRDEALTWADTVVSANRDKDTIIITHSYTYADNTRVGRCDINNAEDFGVGADNDGEEMWERFVSRHSNIVMVLSGHVKLSDGTGRRADLGVNGNLVNQILADYQHLELGGGGYLRIMKVRPSLNRIEVRTYSPYLNAYKTDSHNEFVVPYRADALSAGTAPVQGIVRNAVDCAVLSGATVADGTGSTNTDSTGKFTLSRTSPKAYDLTVTKSGWISRTRRAFALAGLNSPAEVFTSAAGKLQGYVKDTNGRALYGADVTAVGGVLGQTVQIRTNSSGFFFAGWVSPGDYLVQATATGYETAKNTGKVTVGQTSTVTITLPTISTGCTGTGPDPSITICSPSGTTGTSPLQVTAVATSSSTVVHMKIYLDNAEVYARDAASIDTSVPISNGSHYLVVQGWDVAGRVFKNSRTIYIGDSAATCSYPSTPGINVCSPGPGSTVAPYVTFTAAAASGSSSTPITAMRIYVDSVSTETVYADTLNKQMNLSAGQRKITFVAWDSSGKSYNNSFTVTVQ
jgi:Carboxypeptidase regulatory-like domain/Calcineurin-like phosphoesterase